ncbi:MAG TPA: hypothetical protein VGC74_10250 [Stenotrophomonas sp.]|jgi:hypothetical protein
MPQYLHYTLDDVGNRVAEDTKDASGNLKPTPSRIYDQLGQLATQAHASANPREAGHWMGEDDNLGKPTKQVVSMEDAPKGVLTDGALAYRAVSSGNPRLDVDPTRDRAVWRWTLAEKRLDQASRMKMRMETDRRQATGEVLQYRQKS